FAVRLIEFLSFRKRAIKPHPGAKLRGRRIRAGIMSRVFLRNRRRVFRPAIVNGFAEVHEFAPANHRFGNYRGLMETDVPQPRVGFERVPRLNASVATSY